MSKETIDTPVLTVSVGQMSTRGVKPENQDFHGIGVPDTPLLATKGIVVALADGISTSRMGRQAAEMAVQGLVGDYYDTPESWTVKTSATRVIAATNSWLHAQGRRAHINSADEGWVTTLAALILKANHAHILYVGDSRVWQISGRSLQPLTQDHVLHTDGARPMLARAMGATAQVDVSYAQRQIVAGDIFVLTTDGIHDTLDMRMAVDAIDTAVDLQSAAETIVQTALDAGSADNLSIQIIRVETVPPADSDDMLEGLHLLAVPPPPKPGDLVDGCRIIRPLHTNDRSHIHLVQTPGGTRAAMKFPAVSIQDTPDFRRSFAMEEWIARRIDNPHVLRAVPLNVSRTKLYTLTEFVTGQTLRQWMHDNPNPPLQQVRGIIEQIVTGLRTFHRREMLHQDIRPENVMIDADGSVKIIDFGAVFVAGVSEATRSPRDTDVPGTMQYAAPEYFAGEMASRASDLYSVGVIAYEMLTGRLPYGAQVARIRSRRDRANLRYASARDTTNAVPDWIDHALRRAVHPDPTRRHPVMSEFVADLRRPAVDWKPDRQMPLMDRNPTQFWQIVSAALAFVIAILLATRS